VLQVGTQGRRCFPQLPWWLYTLQGVQRFTGAKPEAGKEEAPVSEESVELV